METIRYYQRRGLLAQPDKPLNWQRRYQIAGQNYLAAATNAAGATVEQGAQA